MWAVAGVLLGLVGVTFLAGFHIGPHAHAVSSVLGALAAVSLVALALTGHAGPLLFTLLGADLAVTGGVAVVASKGFSERAILAKKPVDTVVDTLAVALDTLDPDGTVRVRGEVWSAIALNPPVPAGTTVHVMGRNSVRLEVWGDTGDTAEHLFSIGKHAEVAQPDLLSFENRTRDAVDVAGPNEERTPS